MRAVVSEGRTTRSRTGRHVAAETFMTKTWLVVMSDDGQQVSWLFGSDGGVVVQGAGVKIAVSTVSRTVAGGLVPKWSRMRLNVRVAPAAMSNIRVPAN